MKNKKVQKWLILGLILLVMICPFATPKPGLCRYDVGRGLWEETGAEITRAGVASFYMNLYNYGVIAKIIGMPGTPESMTAVAEFIKQIVGGSVTGNPGRGYLNVKIDLETTFTGSCQPGDSYPREALPYNEEDKSIPFNTEFSGNLALGVLLFSALLGGLLGSRAFGRRTAPSGAQ